MTLRGVNWQALRGVLPLLLLLLVQFSEGEQVFSYHYLGCHKDDASARDLNGIGYSLATVHLDNCATKCQEGGYPYVGLQNGQQCFCGMTYGKYGITSAYKCNYTCDQLKCGGYQTNSIYYTVKKDAPSMLARVYEAHGEPLSFTEARKVCVKYDGDLTPITSQKELSDVIAAADDSMADSFKFWFGLRKVNQKFTWTDTALNYDATAATPFWDNAETFQLSCVVVDNRTDKWETSSCSGSYPFVCLQKPAPPTEAPTTAETDTDGATDEGSFFSRQTKITMYVIIPIFFFCYGGSCLLYAISKCYKALRRRQRQKEHQDYFTEFEPDTKPFSLGGRSTPIQPLTSRDINLDDTAPPPQPRLADPVPPYRKDKIPERPVHTPVMALHPRLQDTGPARAKTPQEEQAEKKMAREDQRRNRLLQNALNEARERRNVDTPNSDRPSSDSSNEFPRPPTGPPQKRKSPYHGREGSDGSGDSLSMLLPREQPKADQGAVVDFTKLSIQDIIHIKQIMCQTKKTKPKKILTA